MAVPTARYYFAPGHTWKTADADLVWVEISEYVLSRAGTYINRGRSTELDDYRAGTASFTLDNRGRLFDPSYTAGTYYGDLKPGVPVKIEAVVSDEYLSDESGMPLLDENGDPILVEAAVSTTYPVFRGFIEGWPQDYDVADALPVVAVVATDGFGKLATAATTSSVYAHEVDQDSPVAFWKLDERAGQVMADSSGNGHHGRYDNPELGENTLVWGGVSAAYFAHVGDHRGTVPAATIIEDYPFTFEVWVKFERDSAALHMFLWAQQPDATRVELGCHNDGSTAANTEGALVARCSGDPGAGRGVRGTTPIGDNVPHHCVAVFSDANTIDLYVDGVAETLTTWSALAAMNADSLALCRSWTVGNLPDNTSGDFGLDGTIDEVAVYASALSAARILAHYNAGVSPWDGDTPGERLDRIHDLAGWPADLRDFAAGWTPLGAASLGENILAIAKKVERAEQGRYFIARDGTATFLDRYYHQLETAGAAVQATFSDSGTEIAYSGFGSDYDVRFVYNRVRASRNGGSEVEVLDQTSIDTYGEQVDSSLTGIDVASDAMAQSAAEFRLDRYKDPQLRARPVAVKLHGVYPAQSGIVLSMELGHRVAVVRSPQGVGSAISQETIIEGISHRIGDASWEVTMTTSPVDTRAYALWGSDNWGEGLWGY